MKTAILITTTAVLMTLGAAQAGACPSCDAPSQTQGSHGERPGPASVSDVNLQITFRTELANHGNWHTLPGLGRVWQPYVATGSLGWRPYHSGGGWRLSAGVWSWSSYYPWGNIVYHYGHWTETSGWGWVWIPGTRWNAACPRRYGHYPPVIYGPPPRAPRHHYYAPRDRRPRAGHSAPPAHGSHYRNSRAARAPARPAPAPAPRPPPKPRRVAPAQGSRSERLRNMLKQNIG